MANEVLLNLVVPVDLVHAVEDLLLSRPDLVRGFSSGLVHGHGTVVDLVEAAELVAGHVDRVQIQSVGSEADMRAVLALLKAELPQSNLYYWLLPVLALGRL